MAEESDEFDLFEDEGPNAASDPLTASKAVLYGFDWTVQTIIAQLADSTINLTPRFQRRDAWTVGRKTRFIESLLLGMPVPQLIFAEASDGAFLVLDGKQRLLTLIQFFGRGHGRHNNFALRGLEVLRHLEGKTHDDLAGNISHREIVRRFHNQPIRSVVVRNWPNKEYLELVFVRLNSGSLPLSPQELRLALFPGQFMDFVDDFAVSSDGIQRILKSPGPDFRMRDTEIAIRYLAFQLFAPNYQGDLRIFLDQTCAVLTNEWNDESDRVKAALTQLERAISSSFSVFKEAAFRKWNIGKPESRLNRAVLDVMLYYLSFPELRDAVEAASVQVANAYKDLCLLDGDFRASIEQTTKSMWATATRFHKFGEMLGHTVAVQIPNPGFH
jgi:hypothetical protein